MVFITLYLLSLDPSLRIFSICIALNWPRNDKKPGLFVWEKGLTNALWHRHTSRHGQLVLTCFAQCTCPSFLNSVLYMIHLCILCTWEYLYISISFPEINILLLLVLVFFKHLFKLFNSELDVAFYCQHLSIRSLISLYYRWNLLLTHGLFILIIN